MSCFVESRPTIRRKLKGNGQMLIFNQKLIRKIAKFSWIRNYKSVLYTCRLKQWKTLKFILFVYFILPKNSTSVPDVVLNKIYDRFWIEKRNSCFVMPPSSGKMKTLQIFVFKTNTKRTSNSFYYSVKKIKIKNKLYFIHLYLHRNSFKISDINRELIDIIFICLH